MIMERDPVSQKCLNDSIQACEVSGYNPQLFIPFFWHITQRMGKWEKVYQYCSFVVILIKNDKLDMDCRGENYTADSYGINIRTINIFSIDLFYKHTKPKKHVAFVHFLFCVLKM
jgi:hypothetical protein